MIEKKLSRASQIDIQKCVKNVGGSKFDLVILGAAHARDISRTHKLSGRTDHVNPIISALLDIQNGKIGDKKL